MTLRLNPTCAVRLDPVYEYGPEQTNPETGVTYREITGIKPGVHIDMHPQTIATHPDLAALIIHPENPIHDPGNGVRTWAADEAAYTAAAPVTGSPYDLFVEVEEVEGL
jgi:hypothetical protein